MYKELQEEMKRQGITGYRLAKMIHVCRSDLYCALKGTKPMYQGYKERIAEALKRPVSDLFPEEGGEVNER